MPKHLWLLPVCCSALLYSGLANAEDDENPYVTYREKVMEAASANMGAAAQIISGKIALDARLASHASALQQLLTDLPALFPEGSGSDSSAKPEIWADSAAFAQAADNAQAKAAAFNNAIESGNPSAVGNSFKELGDACKGCHKQFKAKH